MVWVGIDGTDGTGKSTLAEAIVDELERRVRLELIPSGAVKLLHKGPPERSVLEEYATDVEYDHETHYVFDRWHFGELVYAPLYRNTGPYGALGLAGFRWVEKFLQARGATFYVVDQPYDVVKQRLETRGEDYLQSHHVEGVLERYREVQELSCLTAPSFPAPATLAEVPELARNIVNDAVENAAPGAPLRDFPSYVGGPYSEVLLVGEKRGGQPPFASQACFMPLKNKSGEFLWSVLPDPFWRTVGVVNAVEDDVPALLMHLDRPAVVALGGVASKVLTSAGINHGRVPHPQYCKRFHNSRQAEYGALIERVARTGEQVTTWPN